MVPNIRLIKCGRYLINKGFVQLGEISVVAISQAYDRNQRNSQNDISSMSQVAGSPRPALCHQIPTPRRGAIHPHPPPLLNKKR